MFALVVEDEPKMARLIAARLNRSGFEAEIANSLGAARNAIRDRVYRVVLLDRRLPDGDGLSLLPRLREALPESCVLILSALDEVPEKIAGLEAGAADYVTKPFDGDELIARVRAQLRRSNAIAEPTITCGALSLRPDLQLLCISGAPVALQRREVLLLAALMSNLDRVTPRSLLVREVYGSRSLSSYSNALETLVSRLRRQLSELDAGVSIKTARGMGYLLTEEGARQ